MSAAARAQDVVIGSGPGGAITACLLAEHGRAVTVLEAGAAWPAGSCEPFSPQEMRQKYRCGGLNPALGNPPVAFVEGCSVGGGSEINSGLYHRTPEEVLATWRRDYRVAELTAESLAPHFSACEAALEVGHRNAARPGAGEMLLGGAAALGWSAHTPPRWYHPGHEAERKTMSRTFLPRALSAGARLHSGVRVARLRRDGPLWRVESAAGAWLAERVFVCGGAVETPALLRRSGVTHAVGNTLALHPTVKLVARFAAEVNFDGMGVPAAQVDEFSPAMQLGCSVASPGHLMVALATRPETWPEVRERWRHMAVYYAAIEGAPRGSVRNLPGAHAPLVRYTTGADGLRALALGVQRLAKLLLAAGAGRIWATVDGMPAISSDEDLATLAETLPAARANLMTVHLSSSCPLGEHPARCATDSFGRVRGAPGLWVNDASLLCTAPGVNPQGTVMALAHRNALEALGRR